MIEIKQNIRLAPYTTFNIGGIARYFIDVSSEDELREALDFAYKERLRFVIVSGGSNMLFPDDEFGGLVIHISGGDVKFYGNKIIADAGANFTETIRKSAKMGLTGWENMCGIPGSVGGAVRGNAGAFGTEIKDVLSKARAMDVQTGEVRDFGTKECEFNYRTSFFKTHPEWVVLTAVFKLSTVDEYEIDRSTNKLSKPLSPAAHCPGFESSFTSQSSSKSPLEKCDEIVAEREKRHLQNVQCAGSFFKNPVCSEYPEVIRQFETDKNTKSREDRVPAGWLIEQCDLKGTKVGDALCSEQHPNYLVNIGNATQEDVLQLADTIKRRVKDKFGVELEEEVTIIKY